MTRCPIKEITPWTATCMQAYNYYKDGFLPSEGTVFDQSIKIMEAIKFIDTEAERMRKKE